jgi:hypothetical protein
MSVSALVFGLMFRFSHLPVVHGADKGPAVGVVVANVAELSDILGQEHSTTHARCPVLRVIEGYI